MSVTSNLLHYICPAEISIMNRVEECIAMDIHRHTNP